MTHRPLSGGRHNSTALFFETLRSWDQDNVSRLAAALSCYVILSVAPFGLLVVTLGGSVLGQQAARGQIAEQLATIFGSQTARAIETIILNARTPNSGIATSLVGIVVLLFGASGAFAELQSALNLIWNVAPTPRQTVLTFIRQRSVSFLMVLAVAALLLASLVLGTGLNAVGTIFVDVLPGGELVWQIFNASMSLGLTTVLFASVFKVVPDVDIAWKDVRLGAFLTALMFTLGKLLLDLYLGRTVVSASFSLPGSVVAVVLWLYYSSQIVFLGAEFTALHSGRKKNPM